MDLSSGTYRGLDTTIEWDDQTATLTYGKLKTKVVGAPSTTIAWRHVIAVSVHRGYVRLHLAGEQDPADVGPHAVCMRRGDSADELAETLATKVHPNATPAPPLTSSEPAPQQVHSGGADHQMPVRETRALARIQWLSGTVQLFGASMQLLALILIVLLGIGGIAFFLGAVLL